MVSSSGLMFELHDSYTPVLIMVSVVKILTCLLFWFVYLICPKMQRMIAIDVHCPTEETNLNERNGNIPNVYSMDEETALLTCA